MKTIQINKIPDYIRGLTFDGDLKDLRLHWDEEIYHWYADTEQEYKEIEDKICKFEIKNTNYTIYTSCDVSGFNYWMKNMQEHNYIQISIGFENKKFNLKNIEQLKEDLTKAINFCENLECYSNELL